MLDVWPTLPVLFRYSCGHPRENVDNVIAVLTRSDRVRLIDILGIQRWHLKKLSAAMQKPFPELRSLKLRAMGGGIVRVLPDSFLGESAPRLQNLELDSIPFPGLPRLLLSATQLVDLYIYNIPHPGYFSPKAMATALSMLTSLRHLLLCFQSSRFHPDQGNRPPRTRSVLPVLTSMCFTGASEYLDDLVARIDAPSLTRLGITFSNQIIFDTSHFNRFISHISMLAEMDSASFIFDQIGTVIKFSGGRGAGRGEMDIVVQYGELDHQLSSLVHVCAASLPPISSLERLFIEDCSYPVLDWQDTIENMQWLGLLRPFASVKNLFLSEEFASFISPALQEELIEGRTTDILPTLQEIFLPAGPYEGIEQFVAARQATSHPIAEFRREEVREDESNDDDSDNSDDNSDNDDDDDNNDND